jgi:hypothetical protein
MHTVSFSVFPGNRTDLFPIFIDGAEINQIFRNEIIFSSSFKRDIVSKFGTCVNYWTKNKLGTKSFVD